MATYTLQQAPKVWKNRVKTLQVKNARDARAAARYLRMTAISLAPRKTGALIQGILWKKLGDTEYEVASSVPGPFPYNLWVNQTAPFRTIHPWWAHGQSVVYGDGSHRNTGTPRYWYLATIRTWSMFAIKTREGVREALSSGV